MTSWNDPLALRHDRQSTEKQKTEWLASGLLDGRWSVQACLEAYENAKEKEKATCVEACTFATAKQPDLIDKDSFTEISSYLKAKTPRLIWESCRLIAQTISLHPATWKRLLPDLLTLSEHPGTVVRWSAAQALTAIYLHIPSSRKTLADIFGAILAREEKNSIRKIYLQAEKKGANRS